MSQDITPIGEYQGELLSWPQISAAAVFGSLHLVGRAWSYLHVEVDGQRFRVGRFDSGAVASTIAALLSAGGLKVIVSEGGGRR